MNSSGKNRQTIKRRLGIRLLIVDDQSLFAESLKTSLINYAPDIDIIGVAADGQKATEMAIELKPEIILMDVYMPILDGVEATHQILQQNPSTRIVMLSTFGEDEYLRKALEHGASGYLLKDISPTELIASIRALRSGVIQISPQIVERLVLSLHEARASSSKLEKRFESFQRLTKRERDVFFLLATGCENKKIADRLGLAEQTVRNQVCTIYSKLGVHDRFEIIQLANSLDTEEEGSEAPQ